MKNSILKCDGLSLTIPRREEAILNKLSFELYEGDFLVLVGANGSGKSSLLKVMNGRYKATSGRMALKEDAKVVTLNQDASDSLFMDLTVVENALLLEGRFRRVTESQLQFKEHLGAYLASFHDNLYKALHTPVSRLSGGEQQVLALALYIRHKPDLLLLDEHTSALDPKMAIKLMEMTNQAIKTHRLTAVMTIHHPELALQYGNRLLALKDGCIFFEADDQRKARLDKTIMLACCY